MLHVLTPMQSWYIILGLLFSGQERQSPWEMELSKHQNFRNGGILAGRCQSLSTQTIHGKVYRTRNQFPTLPFADTFLSADSIEQQTVKQ